MYEAISRNMTLRSLALGSLPIHNSRPVEQCTIGTKGEIGRALLGNGTLTELSISIRRKKYIVADCKVGVEGAKGIAELLAQNRTIADLRMGIFWYQNNHMGRVLRYRRRGLRVRLWVSGAQQFARNTESQYAI